MHCSPVGFCVLNHIHFALLRSPPLTLTIFSYQYNSRAYLDTRLLGVTYTQILRAVAVSNLHAQTLKEMPRGDCRHEHNGGTQA